jgi:hypothetical protein
VQKRKGANCRLHPLIYTLLKTSLAQYVVEYQLFCGLGNEPPQTGQVFFWGSTIRFILQFGHFTLTSITRLSSTSSKVLLIRFFLLFIYNTGAFYFGAEALSKRVFPIAVPTEDFFFVIRPRKMFMPAWTLLRMLGGKAGFRRTHF